LKNKKVLKNPGINKLQRIRPDHPVFSGMNDFTWELWNGKAPRKISTTYISPIDKNVLGASWNQYSNTVLTGIEEQNIGKGLSFLSQVDAVKLYGFDSAATLYMDNLLKYFLSIPVDNFSAPQINALSVKEMAERKVCHPDHEGFIRDWLVMGAFPNPGTRGKDKEFWGFKNDFLKPLGGEKNVKPLADNKQELRFYDEKYRGNDVEGGRVYHWTEYKSPASGIDFGEIFGGDKKVAYAACYIESPETQECILSLGSDDGFKIWLNHKPVATKSIIRGCKPDSDQFPVTLKKGQNLLLVKIDQCSGGWKFTLRFLNKDNKIPVIKLKINLNSKK
jgi:hypothetical protein